ncbi:MAG: MBL fold metallo-hydrolase [Phycisphaerales bacterium]|nr:MBL fold metallo-hydrolase [Phycisphaerales bacterium]
MIDRFPLGPFETNCFVLRFSGSTDCWFIDAGEEPGEMIGLVRREGLRPVALVLTHAHCDHIAGAFEVVRAFPKLPLMIHEAEREWLDNPMLNLSVMTGVPVTAPSPERLLRDGDELELAGERWRVLHTPGHSPGGITLWHEPSKTAFVGDALFSGSIGRTDFPGSSFDTLARSIRTKLYTLPDETRVLPGHGPETTIGREKRGNPFVRP